MKKINIKTAGKGSHQDYCWYEVVDDVMEKKDNFKVGFDEEIEFLFSKDANSSKLFISSIDSNRKDNWGRSIKNFILLTFENESCSDLDFLVFDYLTDHKKFFEYMNAAFVQTDNQFGFEFDYQGLVKNKSSRDDQSDSIIKHIPYVIDKHDKKTLGLLAEYNMQVVSLKIIVLNNVDQFKGMDDKTIFITGNTTSLKKEIKKYKRKETTKGIAMLAAVVAAMITMVTLKKSKGKK